MVFVYVALWGRYFVCFCCMAHSFVLVCPQYFAFATRRTGKTLYPKSDGLQKPADNAFCTICGQYAVVVHGGIYVPEKLFAPHFRLFFGSKGIEIDKVEVVISG